MVIEVPDKIKKTGNLITCASDASLMIQTQWMCSGSALTWSAPIAAMRLWGHKLRQTSVCEGPDADSFILQVQDVLVF